MDHREHARLAALIVRRRSQLARLEQEVIRVREQLANDEKELERLLRRSRPEDRAAANGPDVRQPSVEAEDKMTCDAAARALHKCKSNRADREACSKAGRYLKRCADSKNKML